MAAHEGTQIYPHEEWSVSEVSFDYESNQRDETIFAIGNGLIGMRGGFEEGYGGPLSSTVDGTYINGFYDSTPVTHPEAAYGLAEIRQTMLNVTNSKIIELEVDNEKFIMSPENISLYKRELDMRRGVLRREGVWLTKGGKELKVEVERLASFERKRVLAISYSVTPLNFSGDIQITSALNGEVCNRMHSSDPRVGAFFSGQVLRLESKTQSHSFAALAQRTTATKFPLVCAMENTLHGDADYVVETAAPDQRVEVVFKVQARQGKPVVLEKFISYAHSKVEAAQGLEEIARKDVEQAAQDGFDVLTGEQQRFVESFWKRANVSIHGDVATAQGLRLNLYHLLQSVGRDGETNIGSKGVTGEGYEGHYFWDTETYVLPVFLYTAPEISRALLEHRFSILDHARSRARELSFRGALYAWRTIGGEELSAYFPAGTAQFHINADIIYALKKYYRATNDLTFMAEKGAEMLFETARFWESFGDYIEGRGFCLNCVTGPDEYTALVNNNTYTNIMVKDHLEFAVEVARTLQQERPRNYERLASRISLVEGEVSAWAKAAESMYLHYDVARGIYGQDDSFLDKAVWDWRREPLSKRPFLMHFHYLCIYRYQIIKQADLLLAMFLQGDRFSRLEKARAYNYYEPLTTHDSSLSLCIHSILACELGYERHAYEYFAGSARMDLDDTHRNVRDGVHCAAMAGSWMSLVFGFGGMREVQGELIFSPSLPRNIRGYSFNVSFKGRVIGVEVTRETVSYSLIEGDEIAIRHRDSPVNLSTIGASVGMPLRPSVRGVVFDLDGVITDTAELHFEAWKVLADELAIPFDRHCNERLKGVSRMRSLEIILERGATTFTQREKERLAERKNAAYQQLVEGMSRKDLLPGAVDLLQKLRKRGIKIALASVSRNASRILEKLEISDLFDVVVDPTTLHIGKPDPEIFLKAAQLLDLSTEECVGIEDADAGVASIKAAGMFAIGVAPQGGLKEADLVVGSLESLPLEQLLRSSLC